MNSDKQISVYDNNVSAREYLSYISESAGGFAYIGRDGKLYIKSICQDIVNVDIEMFKQYKWGEEYKISKVSYEDGVRSFKFGDNSRNNIWINQDNMFIVDENQIENIYNKINGLTIRSFEGTTIINPAIDIGDGLIIDGKTVIYQGEMELQGRFIVDIKSIIQIKQKEEMTVKKQSQKAINRIVKSSIDQAKGEIQQLISEVGDRSEKQTSITQDVDTITHKVENIQELTQEVEANKTILLEECVKSSLLELHIYGNNTVFDSLYLSDDTILNDDTILLGDSDIVVTDKDNNSTVYNLGIEEVLRQNSEVCDECIVKDGQIQVIRRVNKSGSTKAKESVQNLGECTITLSEGTNSIAIINYTARIKAKYAIKNNYTDIFATKIEMSSSINQTAEKITEEVKKKVGEDELGTKIEQNYEHVKIAWNQISEFIQMMIINNNASLAILNNNNRPIMALDKAGQHFYKDTTALLGNMGIKRVDGIDYISFSVPCAYNASIEQGMCWGLETPDENFFPTFYIKNFSMGPKDSDSSHGELVMQSCDLVLDGCNTGIISGEIKMYGDAVGDTLYFTDTSNNSVLLQISTGSSGIFQRGINILNNISFFANQAGSNTLKVGNGSNYCLLTDEGYLYCENATLGGTNSNNGIQIFGSSVLYNGSLNIPNGNVYANNISSDRRLKEDIEDSDICALDVIKKIHHKKFKMKTDNKKYNIGYIAQELEEIEPNFVLKRETREDEELKDCQYYINELPIIATLTKAVQEQQEQIESLKKEIKALQEGKINE